MVGNTNLDNSLCVNIFRIRRMDILKEKPNDQTKKDKTMPDLIIKPSLGDTCFQCFEEAYTQMCISGKYRSATFTVNGLKTTITREQPNDQT